MNKLIIAALLTAAVTSAQARPIMSLDNEGGGKIFLTDDTCKLDGKAYNNLRRTYTYVRTGAVMEGCWYYEPESELVHVVWLPNTRRVYPLSAFTLIEKQPTSSRSSL